MTEPALEIKAVDERSEARMQSLEALVVCFLGLGKRMSRLGRERRGWKDRGAAHTEYRLSHGIEKARDQNRVKLSIK